MIANRILARGVTMLVASFTITGIRQRRVRSTHEESYMSEVTSDSPTNHSAAFASHQHGAVVPVRELDRSVAFYATFFEFQVTLHEQGAAGLTGTDAHFEIAGYQRPTHRPLGGSGVQALIWKLPTPEALLEGEQRLGRLTHRMTWRDQPPISLITTEDPGRRRLLPIGPTTTAAAGAPLHTPIETCSWK